MGLGSAHPRRGVPVEWLPKATFNHSFIFNEFEKQLFKRENRGPFSLPMDLSNLLGIKKEKLIEIVIDLGRRPEARFLTGPEYLSQKIIS